MTSRAFFPANSSSDRVLPDTTSGSANDGAGLSRANMLDSVRDIVPDSQRSSESMAARNLPRQVLCWDMPHNYRRWLAWWYLAIAAGFAALAVDHLLLRDVLWLVGIRLILAAGFGLLSWMEFRTAGRRKS